MIFPFWLQSKKCHNDSQLPNLHPIFFCCQAGKTCCFFGVISLISTIPDPLPFVCHHAMGCFCLDHHANGFGGRISNGYPATSWSQQLPRPPPSTHPPSATTSATAQRQRNAWPLCFFCWGFPGIKGMKGTNIILEDEGNTCQGFFVQQMCPMWQMLVGQFRFFRFRGDFSTSISLSPKEGNLQMWSETA